MFPRFCPGRTLIYSWVCRILGEESARSFWASLAFIKFDGGTSPRSFIISIDLLAFGVKITITLVIIKIQTKKDRIESLFRR